MGTTKAKNLNRLLPPAAEARQSIFVEVNTEVVEAMNKIRERTKKPTGATLSWSALLTGVLSATLDRSDPQAFLEQQISKFRVSMPANRTVIQGRISRDVYDSIEALREKMSSKLGYGVNWMHILEIVIRAELSKMGVQVKS